MLIDKFKKVVSIVPQTKNSSLTFGKWAQIKKKIWLILLLKYVNGLNFINF